MENESNKQTAVEWLMEEMSKTYIFNQDDFDMFKQAKQIEKEQMINFADDYVDNCVIPNENMAIPTKMDVPEYYEEVYGNEDDLSDWDVTLNDGLLD